MKTTMGKGKSMSVLSCDLEGCTTKFHTGSVTGLTRKQAKSTGWGRVGIGRAQKYLGISDEECAEKFRGGRMLDLCPEHLPPPRAQKGPS